MGRKTFYKKVGRPTKLTPKVKKAFCDARSIGSPLSACAAYAGVSYEAVNNWLAIGRTALAESDADPERAITEDEKPYVQFVQDVWEAEAGASITWQQVIHAAATQDPSWAWKMMERWYPTEYKAPPMAIEHSGTDGDPIKHEVTSAVQVIVLDNGRGDSTHPDPA